MSNIRTQIGKIVGKTLNDYHGKVKPMIDELKFKEEYQGRIIDCMVGEVDDNYIETPETNAQILKLENSREGLVKVPSIKGKTILVDSEGNETDTPAEGCRLVSVGEDEDNKLIILSRNKNLFDYDKYNINSQRNMLISVKKGETYTLSFKYYKEFTYSNDKRVQLMISTIPNLSGEGEVEGGVIARAVSPEIVGNRYKLSITSPIDGYLYMRCVFRPLQDCLCDFILLKDEDMIDFIEPKYHKTEILLDEPLRSLPNGVCDEIVGNQLIRRVGKILLKGTENWTLGSTFGEYNRFRLIHGLQFSFKPYEINYNTDRILPVPNKQWQDENEHIELDQLYISITSEIENVNNFKQWLVNNPLELFYEFKEPIIEELPNGITLQGFNDTTMYLENSIVPTVQYGYNALIPFKEELLTQKEEVETNTSDINDNIIPYLMDMEFNLMMMEENSYD